MLHKFIEADGEKIVPVEPIFFWKAVNRIFCLTSFFNLTFPSAARLPFIYKLSSLPMPNLWKESIKSCSKVSGDVLSVLLITTYAYSNIPWQQYTDAAV